MDKDKFNIILHQGIMTSYRIPGYNKIIEKNKGLFVIYGQPQKHSSLKNGDIPDNERYIKIKNFYLSKKREFFIANFFKIILENKPKVIVTQYSFSNLSLFALYFLRPFLKFKIIGWNHGWDRRKGFHPEKSIKDKARLIMLKQADAMIFYSEDAKEKLSNYVDKNKLFVANNTLDTASLLTLKAQFQKRKKNEIKNEIGFKTKHNLIFSARLESPKRPKELLIFFKELQKKMTDISLHIVGSGPLEMELKEIVFKQDIPNVVFYGAIYSEETIGKMIYCSDLMIIPSWVGLSIVHAFCFDCPLVTFDKDFHPPEIIYLKHNKTGYNLWDKSIQEKTTQIIDYLTDEALQKKFIENIKQTIDNEASILKFVDGATNAINFCLT